MLLVLIDSGTVYAYTDLRWWCPTGAVFMSTAELLNELAKLTPAERQEIVRRLTEMDGVSVDLRTRGIDAVAAAKLRSRLERFADDWDSPEMTAYDHYDAAKALL